MSGNEIPRLSLNKLGKNCKSSQTGSRPFHPSCSSKPGFGSERKVGEFVGENSTSSSSDNVIQTTDDDACQLRRAAIQAGYLQDDFLAKLVPGTVTPRLPVINRGTYLRVTAINHLVDRFLQSYPQQFKQIISLGSGSETRYFHLVKRDPHIKLVYHEIDFPVKTALKIRRLINDPSFTHYITPSDALQITNASNSMYNVVNNGTSLLSSRYNVHGLDLRDLCNNDIMGTSTFSTNLSPKLPTLILSECCLCYLQVNQVSQILTKLIHQYLSRDTPVGLILYEPILPHDAFGQSMIRNLNARSINLPTLTEYPTLKQQCDRLCGLGFETMHRAADLNFVWEKWIDPGEKQRVINLEMLDEVEELTLLLQHYSLVWGLRCDCQTFLNDPDSAILLKIWQDLPWQVS